MITRATSPYVGIRPYRQDESSRFFGRDEEARDVATIWPGTGLTVLYGPARVGKTSLLHAGVLPRIKPESADVLPVVQAVRDAVPARGNPYVISLLSGWAPQRPKSALAELTISTFLEQRPTRVDQDGDPLPVLMAIDRAEELFGGPAEWRRDREECLEQLIAAVADHDSLHLLLCLPQEYVHAVLPYVRQLGHGSRAWPQLRPLTWDAALSAIKGPFTQAGRTFRPKAAELLARCSEKLAPPAETTATAEPDLEVDPMQLQVVCAALWESLPEQVHEIDENHVRNHLDVDQFFADFCRRTLTRVARDQDVAVSEIRMWLRAAFVTGRDGQVSVPQGDTDTAEMPNALAKALENRHFLRSALGLDARWYKLQHDRLITAFRDSEPPSVLLNDAESALVNHQWASAIRLALAAMRTRATGWDATRIVAVGKTILGEAKIGQILAKVANGEVMEEQEAVSAHQTLDEAAKIFALLHDPKGNARVSVARGQLWIAQGNASRAVDLLRSAVNRDRNNPTAYLALGEALWHAGRTQEALAAVDAVIDRAPRPLPEALALRDEILGRSDGALAAPAI